MLLKKEKKIEQFAERLKGLQLAYGAVEWMLQKIGRAESFSVINCSFFQSSVKIGEPEVMKLRINGQRNESECEDYVCWMICTISKKESYACATIIIPTNSCGHFDCFDFLFVRKSLIFYFYGEQIRHNVFCQPQDVFFLFPILQVK